MPFQISLNRNLKMTTPKSNPGTPYNSFNNSLNSSRCCSSKWSKLTSYVKVITQWVLSIRIEYDKQVICVFCALTDNGTYWTLCGSVRTKLADSCLNEIPEVRQLIWSTSAGTWRHTLGMSAVSDDGAAASRLLSEVERPLYSCTTDVQVTSLHLVTVIVSIMDLELRG